MASIKERDKEIWHDNAWEKRRSSYNQYKDWYEGVQLTESSSDRVDRKTDRVVKKFPLRINLPKLACDLHRDIARGIPEADAPLIIQSTVERNITEAETVEDAINDVWRMSNGSDIQQRALLDMGIYGGAVFTLRWEPWNSRLPWRVAIRKVKSPGSIHPTWSDIYDPWNMVSCYIGAMISREEAKAKWGIVTSEAEHEVLYLEYWSPTEWWVHVDGRVPIMRWRDREWPLKGENPFGFVPVYYIPHERTTEVFGDSQVPEQTDLVKEFNSRAANISDIVRSTRPGLLVGTDIGRKPEVRPIVSSGNIIAYYIDIGETRALQHAKSPKLDPVPVPDIPEGLIGFPQELLNWWMMVQRISPASFGLDDTSSGRITGPSVAQRMWTSMAHATTERVNFSTAKSILDADIVRAIQAKGEAFGELGITPPNVLGVNVEDLRIKQRWPPMIPLDRQQLHEELINALREGGISLERYLRASGVEDIEEEKERILDLLTRRAEIEAKAMPQQPFGGNQQ